jgi:protein-L-isoaspartate(D-aspartate) O-methyltransferase
MLFKKVTTIERISALHKQSKKKLTQLGFKNISFILGDGHLGFLNSAPYDAIIITAAAEDLPENLIEQLSPSGRIVLPLAHGNELKMES